MRAIGVTRYGGPDALEVLDLEPEPLDGGVRVRVTAAAVNPTDTLVRSGGRSDRDTPEGGAAVPGMDVAGRVLEVAPEATTDLREGDRVVGVVVPQGEHGAYREDVVLPPGSVVATPRGASDAEAATLPMNGLTARLALDTLDLPRGAVLAVTGAAGTLGNYVVQLAKADGLQVVADAAEKDEELVRGLGADTVVARGDDVADRIRELHPDGVDGLVDAAVLDDAVLPAVREGGHVVTVRGYAGDGRPGVRVTPVMVRDYAENREALDRLRSDVEAGTLTLRVADVLPADRAGEAHRRLEEGGVRGRLVLDLS